MKKHEIEITSSPNGEVWKLCQWLGCICDTCAKAIASRGENINIIVEVK